MRLIDVGIKEFRLLIPWLLIVEKIQTAHASHVRGYLMHHQVREAYYLIIE